MGIVCNIMASTYVDIAKDNMILAIKQNEYIDLLKQKNSIYSFGSVEYDEENMILLNEENKRDKFSLITIIFVCMALEAYIYDYSTSYFSSKYYKEHLDNLDIISKYVIIPKLTCNKELKKDGQMFQYFKEIVKLRNKIVHSKSIKISSLEELEIRFSSLDTNYFDYAKKSLELLYLLSCEIDSIDIKAKCRFKLGIEDNN